MGNYKWDFFVQKCTFFINDYKVGSFNQVALLRTQQAHAQSKRYNTKKEILNDFLNALSVTGEVRYTLFKNRPYVFIGKQKLFLDSADTARIDISFEPYTVPRWKDLENFPTVSVIAYLRERGLSNYKIGNGEIKNAE